MNLFDRMTREQVFALGLLAGFYVAVLIVFTHVERMGHAPITLILSGDPAPRDPEKDTSWLTDQLPPIPSAGLHGDPDRDDRGTLTGGDDGG